MREKLLSYASELAQMSTVLDEDETSHSGGVAASPILAKEEREELPLAANILDPVRTTIVCRGPQEMVECENFLHDRCSMTVRGLRRIHALRRARAHYQSLMDGKQQPLMGCALV